MSDGAAQPKPVAPAATRPPAVDLSQLDDKHLARYRHPNERRALVSLAIGLGCMLVGLWVAQWFFGNILDYLQNPFIRAINRWFHPTRLGPIILVGLLLVWIMDVVGQTTRTWQMVAKAVEVTPATFPQLAPIVDELRKRFDLPRTRVFVSRDAPIKGYTIGVREPYAIVFSSIGVASLTPDEFKFTLGREMGSVKLGHTRMATLLGNVRMSLPQPFAFLLKFRAVLFGSYHNAQELSCDRIGVIATRDVRPALSTLIKQNIGAVRGAKIDVKSLAPQTEQLNRGLSGAALRAAMLLNSQPFAVARLAELVAWAGEPVAAVAAPAAPPPPTPAASAAAAAASAAAAAASAAAAAASAAEAAASAASVRAAASPNAAGEAPAAGAAPVPTPAPTEDAAPAVLADGSTDAAPAAPASAPVTVVPAGADGPAPSASPPVAASAPGTAAESVEAAPASSETTTGPADPASLAVGSAPATPAAPPSTERSGT